MIFLTTTAGNGLETKLYCDTDKEDTVKKRKRTSGEDEKRDQGLVVDFRWSR